MALDEIHIRRIAAADCEALRALHHRALDASGANRGEGPWDADLEDPHQSYISAGGEFIVAVHGAMVVAMGALLPRGGGIGEIRRMRVEPSLQRRGLGSAILRRLEEAARQKGMVRLVLDTTAHQLAAQAFYTSHGFLVVGGKAEPPFTLVIFEKLLGPVTGS